MTHVADSISCHMNLHGSPSRGAEQCAKKALKRTAAPACFVILSARSLLTWGAELFMGVLKVCVLPGSSPGTCLLLLKPFCLLGMLLSVAVALQVLLLLGACGWQQHAGALLQPCSVLQQPPNNGQVLLHSCQRCCPGLLTCAPCMMGLCCLINIQCLADTRQLCLFLSNNWLCSTMRICQKQCGSGRLFSNPAACHASNSGLRCHCAILTESMVRTPRYLPRVSCM